MAYSQNRKGNILLGGAKMDLHDKNQPYDEQDDLEQDVSEEIHEEETDEIVDVQEDNEDTGDDGAIKDDGMAEQKKAKNLGVYLAMALCLVALGVGAWATYDTVVKITDITPSTTSSIAPSSSTAEVNQTVSGVPRVESNAESSSSKTESTVSSQITSSQAVSEASSVSGNAAVEPPVESKVPEVYRYPVAGQEIMKGFSNGDPVYNMTTDDWRTHDGLDIGAQLGQNVMSIGVGTVVSSYEDALWGNVLVIRHGDIEVYYCGLAEKSVLEVGATVEDGQILGTVGIVPLEEKENPHIHIQMKKDGIWIDPTRILQAS